MLRDIKSIKMLGLSRVMFQKVSNLRKIELKTSERFRKLLIWEIVICRQEKRLMDRVGVLIVNS